MSLILSPVEREELLVRHKGERDGRVKDRIKAVLHSDDGWSVARIAEALFLSEEGVRQHLADYAAKKKLKPENGGSDPKLDETQTKFLLAHLRSIIYTDTKNICAFVKAKWQIAYTVSGMTDWLHRNGFSYHKPVGVPAKADKAAQEKFIAWYEEFKKALPDDAKLLFGDSVHPTHQTRLTYGWLPKGERTELPTTSGQKRMNIVGALDLEEMQLYTTEFDTIDADAMIVFLKNLEVRYATASAIHLVLDCARYNTCPKVVDFVKNSRITIHHLPPYSPNLNPIERVWKIMHEHTTNNQHHPTFNAFADAILGFLKGTFNKQAKKWLDRINDTFTTLHSPVLQT